MCLNYISLLNFAEIGSLGTFWSILSNGCHGKADRYKNCIHLQVQDCVKFNYHHIVETAIANQNSQILSF